MNADKRGGGVADSVDEIRDNVADFSGR